MKYDLYKGAEYYRACDHQAVQALYIVESRFTVDAADRDVFSIVKTYPADEADARDLRRRGAQVALGRGPSGIADGDAGAIR